jgi:Homing endonuclease associated repeat/HNH endonuclease
MSEKSFKVSRVLGQPLTDAELLTDLRRVAQLLKSSTVSRPTYPKFGQYGVTTFNTRFGSWNKALIAAGLSTSHEINIPDERLFENIFVLWQHYGRQPRRTELSLPPSTISQGPYNRRFRGWTASLHAFVSFANSSDLDSPTSRPHALPNRRTTGRAPSLRLRWKVLQRDRFTCCGCGRSPATNAGIELCVDHVIAWSNGGETTLENLQTLCTDCNLGKSNGLA